MASRFLLQRLPDDPVPSHERKMAAAIGRAADRMNRLLGDYQDLSEIERGPLPLTEGAYDVRTLLDDATAAAGAAVVACEVAPALDVRCDRARILRALEKLIANAVTATTSGGTIRLRAEQGRRERVRISVEDDGPGIAPQVLAHIFDYRWLASRRARNGAGLGIAIAGGIIAAHGGALRIDSTAGGGTIASFTLPSALGAHVSRPPRNR